MPFVGVFVLSSIALVGCQRQGMKQVPAVPKSTILASLPAPWNEYRERPRDEQNGYVQFRTLLTKDQGAVPSIPDGAEEFTDQQVDSLVNEYKPWIKALEASLAKDYWVAPLPRDGVATLFPELALFKSIQKGILFTAREALERGDRERATHYLLLGDWYGDAQSNAGGSIIHLLVGLSLDSMSFKSIVEALSNHDMTEGDLKQLLSASGRPACAEVLRIAALDEVQGTIAYEVAQLRFPEAITSQFFGADTDDEAIVKWERAMQKIFSGHLDPFDKVATARMIVDWWNLLIAAAGEPYQAGLDIDKKVRDSIAPWKTRGTFEMVELGALTEVEVERMAASFRETPNLYGKLFAGMIVSDLNPLYTVLFKHQARGQLLRAAIGVRIYEVRTGRLPLSLHVVVESRILKELPLDPFTGQGIRYDPAQRSVWSAGVDGKDDGGESEEGKDSPDHVVKF